MKWYIAGSIDKNPDFGLSSRAKIRKFLDRVGIDYFCPALLEANKRNFLVKETLIDILHKDEDWQENLKHIKSIVDADMCGLDDCQGLIVLLDKYVGPGTASECTVMNYRGRPVIGIFVKDTNPKEVAPWTLSRVTRFVKNLAEMARVIKTYG